MLGSRLLAAAMAVFRLVLMASALGTELPVPDFFLLGVQKSATTFVSKLLSRVPGLCFGHVKEPHYFDNVSLNKSKVDILRRRYINNFKKCGPGNLTFDATPSTWNHPSVVASSYSLESVQGKRFVLLLRHPVDREFSWYNHQLRACLHQMRRRPFLKQEDRRSIFEALLKQKTCVKLLKEETAFGMYASNWTNAQLLALPNLKTFQEYAVPSELRGDSLYLDLLKKWLAIIKRQQLLILSFQTVASNTTLTLNTIAAFLSVKLPKREYKIPNVISSLTPGAVLDCESYNRLNDFFELRNQGLVTFINGPESGPRWLGEPDFPDFRNEYSCKQGDST